MQLRACTGHTGAWCLAAVLFGSSTGCHWVEDDPAEAEAARIVARANDVSVPEAGVPAQLVFQAIDDEGAPVDGADVFVALPARSPLRLKSPEAAPGTSFARATTGRQTVDRLAIDGAFVVEIDASAPMPEGRYPVFAGLGESPAPETDDAPPLVEIDVLVPERSDESPSTAAGIGERSGDEAAR